MDTYHINMNKQLNNKRLQDKTKTTKENTLKFNVWRKITNGGNL